MVFLGNRWICFAFSGLLLAALTGCGPLIIKSNPSTFSVPADAAAQLVKQQSVALNNAYKAETQVRIFTGTRDWQGDLQQYTDTAITLLGREMTKKGTDLSPQSAKTITLRVRDVQASPGWVIRSVLVLEAQYGDGTISTIASENTSPSDAWRAVDGAIMRAVSQLLRDDKFLAYVNRK